MFIYYVSTVAEMEKVSRRRELILKLTIELLFVKQFVGIVLKMVSSKQISHV